MVQLILGNEGKGKTKLLLNKVNDEVQKVSGSIVYLDKSTKNMYELNNKIRLIDVSEYMISCSDEFIGFICGIISQDHDLEQMYFDNFLKIACIGDESIDNVIEKLEKISDKFKVDFLVSICLDENTVSETLKSKIMISL